MISIETKTSPAEIKKPEGDFSKKSKKIAMGVMAAVAFTLSPESKASGLNTITPRNEFKAGVKFEGMQKTLSSYGDKETGRLILEVTDGDGCNHTIVSPPEEGKSAIGKVKCGKASVGGDEYGNTFSGIDY